MKNVFESNRDKLPEESLVKVLSHVYLDAKTTLKSIAYLQVNDIEVNKAYPKTNFCEVPKIENKQLSFMEKKQRQWENEKAELSTMGSYALCDKRINSTNENFSNLETNVVVPFGEKYQSDDSNTNSIKERSFKEHDLSNVSTFNSMLFGFKQDEEQAERDRKRKQWKAELDAQVMHQKLLREREKEGNNRKSDFFNELRHENQKQLFGETNNQEEMVKNLNKHSHRIMNGNSHVPHPSASHFNSASFCLQSLDELALRKLNSENKIDQSLGQSTKTEFNQPRRITQQVYMDLTEHNERARLAHETQRINLQQIEEKRRLKEEEKAKQLLIDQREEERLARERAQVQNFIEAENARRRKKMLEEEHQTQLLHQSILKAQEESRLMKQRKLSNECRPNEGPNNYHSNGFGQQPALQDYAILIEQPNPQASAVELFGHSKLATNNYLNLKNASYNTTDTVHPRSEYHHQICQGEYDCLDRSSVSESLYDSISKRSVGSQTVCTGNVGVQTEPTVDQTANRTLPNTKDNKNRTYTIDLKEQLNKIRQGDTIQTNGSNGKLKAVQNKSNGKAKTNALMKANRMTNKGNNQAVKSMINKNKSNSNSSVGKSLSSTDKSKTPITESLASKSDSSNDNYTTNCCNLNDKKENSFSKYNTRIPVPVSNFCTPRPQHPVDLSDSSTVNDIAHCKPLDLIRTYDILNPFSPRNDVNCQLEDKCDTHLAHNQFVNAKKSEKYSLDEDDSIFQHLSEIRQGLKIRQMLCESNNYDDSDG